MLTAQIGYINSLYIQSSLSKVGQVNMDNPTLSNFSARGFVTVSKLHIKKAVFFWPAGYFFPQHNYSLHSYTDYFVIWEGKKKDSKIYVKTV